LDGREAEEADELELKSRRGKGYTWQRRWILELDEDTKEAFRKLEGYMRKHMA
jgi:hypothetical protein